MMTKKEKALTAHLLNLSSDEFSNHGCNDVSESVFKDWTLEERQELVKGYHEWNGDPEEYSETFLDLGDSMLMSYLASKLLKEDDVKPKKIVEAIIDDLSDRRGLGNEWEQIDEDVQKEIIDKWIGIIKK